METQTAIALVVLFLGFVGGFVSIKVDTAETKLTTETILCKLDEDAQAIKEVTDKTDSVVNVLGIHLAKCDMKHGGE